MKVLAVITDPQQVRRILRHLFKTGAAHSQPLLPFGAEGASRQRLCGHFSLESLPGWRGATRVPAAALRAASWRIAMV